MDDGDLSRRERKKRAVRGSILEAAVGRFDQQGFAGTTVGEICEDADVAQKTFFNYFPTKQHLLREVAQDGLERLLSVIEDARKEPGPTRSRLLYFFQRVADDAEQAGPMHRELLNELIHVAHAEGSGSEQARKLHEAFGALVREGIRAGELTRKHSAETLTEMLQGAFYVLMFNWAHLEGYPLRKQALCAAKFLGDAMAPRPVETRS